MADALPSVGLIRQVQLPGGGIYKIVDYSTTASKGFLQDQVDDMQNPNLEGSLQKQINDLSEIIGGGVNFKIAWTQANYESLYPYGGPPADLLNTIPQGVTVYYANGSASASGNMAAGSSTKGDFILLYSKTQAGNKDKYDEYVTITTSTSPSTYAWEKIGDTQIDLTGIVTDVSLSTSASNVLGTNTTAALACGAVTYGAISSAKVLTPSIVFDVTQPTISVTPSTVYLKGTATGGGYGSPTTSWIGANATGTSIGATGTASAITSLTATNATFVKNIKATTSKLVTTTVPNVTSASNKTVNKSNWSFNVAGDDGQTLIIGGSNGDDVTATEVTLGAAITVATGSITSNGGGGSLLTGVTVNDSGSALTGLNTPTTADVLTGVEVTAQPTITLDATAASATGKVKTINALGTQSAITVALASDTSSGTGKVQIVSGISSAVATDADVSLHQFYGATTGAIDAVTAIPTASVSTGVTITKDNVNALTSASLTVTKG